MKTLKPMAGDHISDFVSAIIHLADTTGESAGGEFNGITVTARPGDNADDLLGAWSKKYARKAEEYRNSPAGIESAKQAEAACAKAKAAEAEGILPFVKSDPDGWDTCVRVNSDEGYGACTVRYAARWANIMERRIESGEVLEDIADAASDEANVEGITGFMHGCAVGILSQVWQYGEQLRRWHNVKTQIGTEGERANEEGGVLNPAILNIG